MELKDLLVIGLAMLGGLLLFFSGRLKQRYGTLRPREAVTRAYEQHELNPDSAYYSSGPDVYPHALIEIDKRFQLTSDLWKQRDFSPETFRETIRNMQGNALMSMQTLHGFEIVDHRNNRLGTWFSVLNIRTTIKMLKDNGIRIDPPVLPGIAESP